MQWLITVWKYFPEKPEEESDIDIHRFKQYTLNEQWMNKVAKLHNPDPGCDPGHAEPRSRDTEMTLTIGAFHLSTWNPGVNYLSQTNSAVITIYW